MSTLEQERINQYLEDLAERLDDLPPQERREELMRIRLRLERGLMERDGAVRRNGVPAAASIPAAVPATPRPVAAPVPAPRPAAVARPLALSTRNVEWLGVCAGLADFAGVDPLFVRLGAVALGLLTGPFALLAYLVAYSALSVSTPAAAMSRPDGWRVVRAVAASTATALLVFAVAQALVWVVMRSHAVLMGPLQATMPHPWSWFLAMDTPLFFWAILSAVPLAILGALPLTGQWNTTLAKVSQAVVALFGIAAAFGVACLFVGMLLQVLPHLTGIGVASLPQ